MRLYLGCHFLGELRGGFTPSYVMHLTKLSYVRLFDIDLENQSDTPFTTLANRQLHLSVFKKDFYL